MTKIRPALPADAGDIAALLDQLGYPETIDTLRDRLQVLCGRRESEVFVAEDESRRIIGCAHVLIDHRLAEGLRGEITSIVVDERRQSRGSGARLVRAAGAWVAEQGIDRMRVRCNARRGRAHRFYEKLGFQMTKNQKVFDIPVDGFADRPATP